MANKVSLSLPPQSMQWGRSVEERLQEMERVASNLSTSVASTNASLSAVLKSNRELASQQTWLENYVTKVSATGYGSSTGAGSVVYWVEATTTPITFPAQATQGIVMATSELFGYLPPGAVLESSNLDIRLGPSPEYSDGMPLLKSDSVGMVSYMTRIVPVTPAQAPFTVASQASIVLSNAPAMDFSDAHVELEATVLWMR